MMFLTMPKNRWIRLPGVMQMTRFTVLLMPVLGIAANIPADISGVRPGVITVAATAESLTVRWPDEASRTWIAEFSLDSAKPLITKIGLDGRAVVRNASPQYWAATGKRRGRAGFDEFFDNPNTDPEGTRRFEGVFQTGKRQGGQHGRPCGSAVSGTEARNLRRGDRLYLLPRKPVSASGGGGLDAGTEHRLFIRNGNAVGAAVDAVRPGRREVVAPITYYDADGKLQTVMTSGPDRRPAYVRYRAIAAKLDGGSLAVFPSPHTYIAPRDYTTNMGYVWFHGWAGRAAPGAEGVLGVRNTASHRRWRRRILSLDQRSTGHGPALGSSMS